MTCVIYMIYMIYLSVDRDLSVDREPASASFVRPPGTSLFIVSRHLLPPVDSPSAVLFPLVCGG